MRNDVGIRECLDSRQRSVALLNWHIEPEDESSSDQREFCSLMESICRRISHFTEYRENCQHAIWYGKYAIQHRWGAQIVGGPLIWMPTHGTGRLGLATVERRQARLPSAANRSTMEPGPTRARSGSVSAAVTRRATS
jgi:hypothetical protein